MSCPIGQCRVNLIDIAITFQVTHMPKTALLTPTSSPILLGGYDGPGHSALVVGTKVYSFGDNGGWYVTAAKSYMAENNWRCVLVQHFDSSKVDGDKMKAYLTGSVEYGAWYVWNGLCSHQAGYAIDAATDDEFDPSGFNTPDAVALEVSHKGYETDRYLVMPTKTTGGGDYRTRINVMYYYKGCPVGQPKFYEWKD